MLAVAVLIQEPVFSVPVCAKAGRSCDGCRPGKLGRCANSCARTTTLDTVADPAVQPAANGDTIVAASSLMVSQDAGIANPVSFLEELSSLNLSHLSTSCLPSEPGQFLTALDDLTLNLESSISTPTELPPLSQCPHQFLLGVSWIRPPLLTL